MTRIQAPLTLPKHPDLLHRINKMSIDIKLSYLLKGENKERAEKALGKGEPPTWEDVVNILDEARNAINEQREDPRKY
jgi:hypothetical protein